MKYAADDNNNNNNNNNNNDEDNDDTHQGWIIVRDGIDSVADKNVFWRRDFFRRRLTLLTGCQKNDDDDNIEIEFRY